MVKIDMEAIRRLSVPDRVRLMNDIWDSLQPTADRLPITDAQRAELDRRLAAHEADPDAAMSFEEFRAQIEQS